MNLIEALNEQWWCPGGEFAFTLRRESDGYALRLATRFPNHIDPAHRNVVESSIPVWGNFAFSQFKAIANYMLRTHSLMHGTPEFIPDDDTPKDRRSILQKIDIALKKARITKKPQTEVVAIKLGPKEWEEMRKYFDAFDPMVKSEGLYPSEFEFRGLPLKEHEDKKPGVHFEFKTKTTESLQ